MIAFASSLPSAEQAFLGGGSEPRWAGWLSLALCVLNPCFCSRYTTALADV